jgi:gamma-glutamylcyclotransferase (GGCT)/AIG2-like uncharacterized protein YtfP
MAEYLFTYGTLQPGHAPAKIASVADRLRLIGPGHIHGTLYDFGYYPGAVLDPSTPRKIFGTVYELPDDPAVLQRLDEYEDCYRGSPEFSQYLRVRHPVELAIGQTIDCWIYVYNRDVRSARIVEDGKWGWRSGSAE